MPLTVLHSPDADDRFMFWALKTGRLASPFDLQYGEGDTQSLNERALRQEADVIAISAAAYPAVADHYQPLKMGCSIGDGYGPVLVARQARTLDSLAGKRIAVPGLRTTACQVLQTMLDFEPVVVPIDPMERIFDVLATGDVEAALVIHEGRLIYERFGTVRVGELGEMWMAATDTPLPLGMNVIRRSLPLEVRQQLSSLFIASFDAGAAARDAFVADYLVRTPMDEGQLQRYLDMYANDSTRAVSARDQLGFQRLYERLQATGLIATTPVLDWI
jgi:1,4-dihydroxy-6-naphthoate synthase